MSVTLCQECGRRIDPRPEPCWDGWCYHSYCRPAADKLNGKVIYWRWADDSREPWVSRHRVIGLVGRDLLSVRPPGTEVEPRYLDVNRIRVLHVANYP